MTKQQRYIVLTRKECDVLKCYQSTMTNSELRQYVFSKGFHDKSFFMRYYLESYGYIFEEEMLPDVPEHFVEIRDALDNSSRQVLIEPRGHGKTTAILVRILRALVYRVHKSILYLASSGLGQVGIGKIRGELETNEKILMVFGNLVPNNSDDPRDKRLKRWSSQKIELLNGCYLATISKRKPLRGQRFKRVLVDDPQEDSDVNNPKQVAKFNNWFLKTVMGMLMPNGGICVIGTVISNNCLVNFLSKEKKRATIKRQACDANFENILRPQLWSKFSLLQKMEDMGTAVFNQEYRHIAIKTEESQVSPEWIRTYKTLPKTFDYKVFAIDPKSKREDAGDQVGFCIIGVKVFEDVTKYYVIYSKGIRLSPKKQEGAIIKIIDHYEPDDTIKEDNIERGITEGVEEKGYKIKGIFTHKNKMSRLLTHAGKIEFGNVLFREKGDEQLIEQLTTFPDSEFDDVLDSFLIAMDKARSKFGKKAKIRVVKS